jgi:hypothetical protein
MITLAVISELAILVDEFPQGTLEHTCRGTVEAKGLTDVG